jgi:hypothetical protein
VDGSVVDDALLAISLESRVEAMKPAVWMWAFLPLWMIHLPELSWTRLLGLAALEVKAVRLGFCDLDTKKKIESKNLFSTLSQVHNKKN